MIFGESRREKMVRIILASEDAERQAALEELLPLQQHDFEAIFEAMDACP
jgi:pyruvate, orthophosphate dikinase